MFSHDVIITYVNAQIELLIFFWRQLQSNIYGMSTPQNVFGTSTLFQSKSCPCINRRNLQTTVSKPTNGRIKSMENASLNATKFFCKIPKYLFPSSNYLSLEKMLFHIVGNQPGILAVQMNINVCLFLFVYISNGQTTSCNQVQIFYGLLSVISLFKITRKVRSSEKLLKFADLIYQL